MDITISLRGAYVEIQISSGQIRLLKVKSESGYSEKKGGKKEKRNTVWPFVEQRLDEIKISDLDVIRMKTSDPVVGWTAVKYDRFVTNVASILLRLSTAICSPLIHYYPIPTIERARNLASRANIFLDSSIVGNNFLLSCRRVPDKRITTPFGGLWFLFFFRVSSVQMKRGSGMKLSLDSVGKKRIDLNDLENRILPLAILAVGKGYSILNNPKLDYLWV